jgi:hypothetical protein
MTASGRLAYVATPVRVDEAFAARLNAGGRAERRYRFTGPCVEAQCPQWTGARCGVADALIAHTTVPAPVRIPACRIRRNCRWFDQSGVAACRVCPLVVADVGGTGTYRQLHETGAGACG